MIKKGWILILLLISVVQAVSASALEVRFRPSAKASGEILLLGEVADILPPSDQARLLESQTLFRSPAPGEDGLYKAEDIRSYLQRSEPDLDDVTWSGAAEIRVSRAGITIDQGRITQIIEAYLKEKSAILPQAKFSFQMAGRVASFVLPQGELSYDVIPSSPSIVGSSRFTLIFRVDGRVVKNQSVRVQMQALAPLAVATTELRRGQVIQESDVQLAEMDLGQVREPCFDLDELIGKKARRTIRLGEAIERGYVEFPPLVKRGDLVTITASKGALAVTATGLAREDGKKGDTIKVRNTASQKDILCRVTAPGAVEVEF